MSQVVRMLVTMEDAILGGIGTNTWHASVGDDSEEDVSTLADRLNDFYDACKEIYPDTTKLRCDAQAVIVSTPDPGLIIGTGSWEIDGTGDTHPMPPANCLVAGWGTSNLSRNGRGRTFLGPLTRDMAQDNGTPYETTRTLIENAGEALIAAQAPPDDPWFGVWSSEGPTLRPFRRVKVANRFAVLRSRRD